MEYESRQVKWYFLLLFTLFCGGVVYLLFSGNPYLYSHLELRSALMVGDSTSRHTVPYKPAPPVKLGQPTWYARYGLQRTANDPFGAPRSRAYEEFEHHAVDLSFEVGNVTGDDSGFYVSGKSPLVAAVGLDGKVRWQYRFLELGADRAIGPILLDEGSAYVFHPAGRIIALDKTSGTLRWVMDLRQELVAQPFLWQKNIYVPVKGATSGIQLVTLHRADGQAEATNVKLDIKPGFTLAFSPALEAFVATADNKVIAIDPAEWEILWSQTLTDPVKGPAVINDHAIYVSTLGAKIVKLDSSKKGKIEWEADLEKPAASPPAYLPIMQKLSFLDTAGHLNAVDAKAGKVLWRTPTENRNPLVETWSARLKGNNIEEFKMDWLHKGWTIWGPCADRRVCIYTPGKGQLIERIALSGSPMGLPLALEKRLAFFTQVKPGKYSVSLALEESEVKKLKGATP